METINFLNYVIEVESDNGHYLAKCKKITERAKFGYKQMFYYSYRNEERMNKHIQEMIEFYTKCETERIERKQAKKEARKQLKASDFYKVGDILEYYWGYDQTNIDFFQITEVNEKSIKIREISGHSTYKKGYSSMSAFTAPNKDDFTGKEITKVIQFYLDNNNKPVAFLSMPFGCLSPYKNGTEGSYYSWYA